MAVYELPDGVSKELIDKMMTHLKEKRGKECSLIVQNKSFVLLGKEGVKKEEMERLKSIVFEVGFKWLLQRIGGQGRQRRRQEGRCEGCLQKQSAAEGGGIQAVCVVSLTGCLFFSRFHGLCHSRVLLLEE